MGVLSKLSQKPKRLEILNKYNSRCAYCGWGLTINTLTIDHIEPLKRHIVSDKSGLNSFSNYNPCCASCNSSKGCMTLDKWRSEIYMKVERLNRDSSSFRLLVRFGLIKTDIEDIKFYFETL